MEKEISKWACGRSVTVEQQMDYQARILRIRAEVGPAGGEDYPQWVPDRAVRDAAGNLVEMTVDQYDWRRSANPQAGRGVEVSAVQYDEAVSRAFDVDPELVGRRGPEVVVTAQSLTAEERLRVVKKMQEKLKAKGVKIDPEVLTNEQKD